MELTKIVDLQYLTIDSIHFFYFKDLFVCKQNDQARTLSVSTASKYTSRLSQCWTASIIHGLSQGTHYHISAHRGPVSHSLHRVH